jgi:hypothetical protein
MLGKVIIILVVLFAAAASFAQADHYNEIPITQGRMADAIRCRPESGGYDRPPTFTEFYKKECEAAVAVLNVNYETSRLLYWSASSDCHMRVVVKLFRSDVEKRVRLVLNNIYGGCRASGRRAGWVVIDKPPAGYTVSIDEVGIDRIHGINDDGTGFVFPSPLSVVTSENVEFRSVDFADCLPLTGQSRWILSSQEHLDAAFENRPNAAECREKLKNLNIDLSQQTFAGASFATGYCDRPNGLELSMTKETSTNPRENRYVLKAVYDDPTKPCASWTTFPVWFVIPKMTPGQHFDVDARPRSKTNEPREDQRNKPVGWIETE